MSTIYTIIGHSKKELQELINSTTSNYTSFPIQKSNGRRRWIDAPNKRLKEVQHATLYRFLYKFSAHPCSIGFVKGKSVKDGAKLHLGAKTLISMDIYNFFNSIKLNKVRRNIKWLFKKYKGRDKKFTSNVEDINIIAKILTHYEQLPQGAPTSPTIANIVCLGLDKDLQKWAKVHKLVYHRYADDINFSSTNKIRNVHNLVKEIESILRKHNFKVNKKKTRVRRHHRRMKVTGIVVNEKLSVERWRWRNFQAKLYNLSRDKIDISLKEYQQLRGYVEWIRTLNQKRAEKLMSLLGKVNVNDS